MTRTLVLGLDGVTFDVLDPMIEEDIMPNLAGLRDRGASGTLLSTIPAVTGPAWLSLATGLSPGSTGIYDFIHRDPFSPEFDMKYIDSSTYRGKAVWDYLGDAGQSVGVVDYPTLTPPYEVNGFIISGGLGAVGHRVYPERLEDDLAGFEKPEGHLDLRDDAYEADLAVFMDDIRENLERRATIAEHVLATESWDFCWTVFQEPDWVQHLMWKVHDGDHFEADTVTDRDRTLWREFWAEVDDVIGRCLDAVDEETNVVVQSDHGFGPMRNRSLRVNKWLVENGYMVPKSAAGSHFWLKKRIRNLLSDVAAATNLKVWAPGLFAWGKNRTLSFAIQLNAIDLEQTQVFDPGHIGSMGGLYVNERVVDADDEADLLAEIERKLLAFGEENGLDLEIDFPKELYGKKTAASPDMIVREPGTQIEDGGWDSDSPIIDGRPERLSHQNGSHRQPGVLIAAGPDFETTTFEEADVFDLAPTLLHCHGVPVPESMDGEVLSDLLVDAGDVEYATADAVTDDGLGGEERPELEEQLSDLGYFE